MLSSSSHQSIKSGHGFVASKLQLCRADVVFLCVGGVIPDVVCLPHSEVIRVVFYLLSFTGPDNDLRLFSSEKAGSLGLNPLQLLCGQALPCPSVAPIHATQSEHGSLQDA